MRESKCATAFRGKSYLPWSSTEGEETKEREKDRYSKKRIRRERKRERERRESTVLGLVLGSNSAHFMAKLFQEGQSQNSNQIKPK